MTTQQSPAGSVAEVRFAVVMYGGVSLAIYINGIAQELLRMVRATATSKDPVTLQDTPLVPRDQLKHSSERVYRKLSYLLAGEQIAHLETPLGQNAPITTRFVIDVISGTSAGGINGIFLAKALANGQSIDDLENLWVREGSFARLINDRQSNEKPLTLQRPPESLLNSERMYHKLLDAFAGMDQGDKKGAYVDELDLFCDDDRYRRRAVADPSRRCGGLRASPSPCASLRVFEILG